MTHQCRSRWQQQQQQRWLTMPKWDDECGGWPSEWCEGWQTLAGKCAAVTCVCWQCAWHGTASLLLVICLHMSHTVCVVPSCSLLLSAVQDMFWEDGRVLFISIHQDSNYPLNSGESSKRGTLHVHANACCQTGRTASAARQRRAHTCLGIKERPFPICGSA